MDNFGDPMDIDGPSFNQGRRRSFDEFAEGEEVQVDRLNYATAPVPLARSGNPFAAPTADVAPEPSLQRQDERRPISWPRTLVQTVAVGAIVIVVVSAHVCRISLRQAARTGRRAYDNGHNIRQTCTAVVQSAYGSTKRRIITVTGNIPAFPPYRRRLPPSSFRSSPPRTPTRSPPRVIRRPSPPPPRPSPPPPRPLPEIVSGHMLPGAEEHVQGQLEESQPGEPFMWVTPVTPQETISVDAESTHPYMMRGGVLTADDLDDFELDAEELAYSLAVFGGNDESDSDESYVTAPEYMDKGKEKEDEVEEDDDDDDEEEDVFFDVPSGTSKSDDKPSSPVFKFEEPDQSNPVFDQLTRALTHRVVVPQTPTPVRQTASRRKPSTSDAVARGNSGGDLWGADDLAAVSHGERSAERTTGSPLPGADRPVGLIPVEGTAGSLVAQADRPAVPVPSRRRRRTEMPAPRRVQPPRACRKR